MRRICRIDVVHFVLMAALNVYQAGSNRNPFLTYRQNEAAQFHLEPTKKISDEIANKEDVFLRSGKPKGQITDF